jgi:hypothetical protein
MHAEMRSNHVRLPLIDGGSRADAHDTLYSIGDLARLTGLTVKAIRF